MKSLILTTVASFVLFSTVAQAQQTDRDLYLGLFQNAQYDKALTVLKRITKQNSADGEAWYYLGLTHLGAGKEKDAAKALQKAAELRPGDAHVHASLAYVYLLRNDPKAARVAQQALKLSPKNAEAHYVLGVVSLRDGSFNAAYERAKKVIELDPDFPSAYLLRSQALASSFAIQTGTVLRPKSSRHELLEEAVSDLEKYIALKPNSSEIDFHRSNLESLKFFAEYYGRPENQGPINFEPEPTTDAGKTPLKIHAKPRASYTDQARHANVSGTVRVLVGFSADGKIKHVMIVRSLGYGLDEQSVRAARQIKFDPPTKDGKPISTVRMFEYSFAIY